MRQLTEADVRQWDAVKRRSIVAFIGQVDDLRLDEALGERVSRFTRCYAVIAVVGPHGAVRYRRCKLSTREGRLCGAHRRQEARIEAEAESSEPSARGARRSGHARDAAR